MKLHTNVKNIDCPKNFEYTRSNLKRFKICNDFLPQSLQISVQWNNHSNTVEQTNNLHKKSRVHC